MNRETIREKTMQMIYQMEITGNFDYESLNIIAEDMNILGKKQAVEMLVAVREYISDIDTKIEANLDNWAFGRISKTDLAILRTAVCEMMYMDSIPRAVSINEAVKLSKKYGDEKSYKFVNSVLAKIDRDLSAD
ncbi:MAG: transcription antitermination factor NusB [Mogibacterium sp.]|nr:transcription antitermination factor NusB [Mogibacterium sp.]